METRSSVSPNGKDTTSSNALASANLLALADAIGVDDTADDDTQRNKRKTRTATQSSNAKPDNNVAQPTYYGNNTSSSPTSQTAANISSVAPSSVMSKLLPTINQFNIEAVRNDQLFIVYSVRGRSGEQQYLISDDSVEILCMDGTSGAAHRQSMQCYQQQFLHNYTPSYSKHATDNGHIMKTEIVSDTVPSTTAQAVTSAAAAATTVPYEQAVATEPAVVPEQLAPAIDASLTSTSVKTQSNQPDSESHLRTAQHAHAVHLDIVRQCLQRNNIQVLDNGIYADIQSQLLIKHTIDTNNKDAMYDVLHSLPNVLPPDQRTPYNELWFNASGFDKLLVQPLVHPLLGVGYILPLLIEQPSGSDASTFVQDVQADEYTRVYRKRKKPVETVGKMIDRLIEFEATRTKLGSKNLACAELGWSKATINSYVMSIRAASEKGIDVNALRDTSFKDFKAMLSEHELSEPEPPPSKKRAKQKHSNQRIPLYTVVGQPLHSSTNVVIKSPLLQAINQSAQPIVDAAIQAQATMLSPTPNTAPTIQQTDPQQSSAAFSNIAADSNVVYLPANQIPNQALYMPAQTNIDRVASGGQQFYASYPAVQSYTQYGVPQSYGGVQTAASPVPQQLTQSTTQGQQQ